MTYRQDSDIYTPFGKLYKNVENSQLHPVVNDSRKLAVWLVSHCQTDSAREKYVKVRAFKVMQYYPQFKVFLII